MAPRAPARRRPSSRSVSVVVLCICIGAIALNSLYLRRQPDVSPKNWLDRVAGDAVVLAEASKTVTIDAWHSPPPPPPKEVQAALELAKRAEEKALAELKDAEEAAAAKKAAAAEKAAKKKAAAEAAERKAAKDAAEAHQQAALAAEAAEEEAAARLQASDQPDEAEEEEAEAEAEAEVEDDEDASGDDAGEVEEFDAAQDVPAQCHAEAGAEFGGSSVVVAGDELSTPDAAQCCHECSKYDACNVWVWCGRERCEGDRARGECWLKHSDDLNPNDIQGRRNAGSGWTSGAKYSRADKEKARRAAEGAVAAERRRLAALRSNASLPLVFFDVTIKGKAVGRIEMALFIDAAPRAAENFRQLCTGEAGVVPQGHDGEGLAYHFKGAPFYRIIDQFIDQAGVNVESVFGGQFKDDAGGTALRHEHKGLLSMANMGPNTNTAHFSIMMGPAPHLDGSYTIFGQVVTGLEVVDAINALSRGQPDNTATEAAGARIADCGQLRKGTLVPNLELRRRARRLQSGSRSKGA